MSRTVVYLETSLTHSEARNILPDADYLPSIKKGDVLQAIKNGYEQLVIIDGNFGWTPAVWHKEILIALDYGLSVFGASSMGAIRAAELDNYGMVGVGVVYDRYKTGQVNGDDEVAIAFFKDYHDQTVPLINLRITLEADALMNLDLGMRDDIFQEMKAIYYVERTWERIAKILPKEVYALIRENYIDIKKCDVIEVLNRLRLPSAIGNYLEKPLRNRDFTVFEKRLIESVFNPFNGNDVELKTRVDSEQAGDYKQLLRAKNLIKLLSIEKTRDNLIYYQSIMSCCDEQCYVITELELMDQVSLFREENNLLLGADFKRWLNQKYLLNSNLEIIFTDYVKLKKYLLISVNYNQFLQ